MTHDPVSHLTPRILRLVTVSTALAALALAASPASAQQRVAADPGARPGMRYLTWPGKDERPRTSPSPYAGPSLEPAVPSGPIMSMPSQPVITAGIPNRYSARTSPGPTPATAWIANGGAPTARYAPPPAMTYAEAPAPVYSAPPAYASPYAAAYAAPVPGVPEPPRDYAPAPPMPRPMAPPPVHAEPAPAYVPPVHAAAPPVAADSGPAVMEAAPAPPPPVVDAPVPAVPVADPMAPRSDAPIFRLLNRSNAPPSESMPEMAPEAEDEAPRRAPTPRPEAAPPPPPPPPAAADDRSPRRYSVHRANGQQPDRTPLPNPVMLDSMPVDLAAPPETPTVIRDANGRVQTIIPSEDPGLQ